MATDAQAIAGHPVTVGAWIWASSPGPASLPQVGDSPASAVTVGANPAFFAETISVPPGAQRLGVSLVALPAAGEQEAARTIYYDGVVLVDGVWPAGSEPELDNAGRAGVWAGRAFNNLIRNASAEQAGPWVRPWAESLFQRTVGSYLSPSALVGALADYDRNQPIYARRPTSCMNRFGRASAGGRSPCRRRGTRLAAVLTGLGVAAALPLWRIQGRQPGSWKLAMAWLGLAVLAVGARSCCAACLPRSMTISCCQWRAMPSRSLFQPCCSWSPAGKSFLVAAGWARPVTGWPVSLGCTYWLST